MIRVLNGLKCIIINKEVKTMDMNKYAMLKAILPQKVSISVSSIKGELNVSSEEAEEMLNALKQEGSVESFSFDGRSFLVRK